MVVITSYAVSAQNLLCADKAEGFPSVLEKPPHGLRKTSKASKAFRQGGRVDTKTPMTKCHQSKKVTENEYHLEQAIII